MKNEKEIKASSENSSEELESVLDKTDNYNEEQLENELEKLAETFRNELKKAKEQGDSEASETEVVDEKNNAIPKEELCECCGERKKDTSISANYRYCSECRELMKRYPVNFASVIIAVAIVLVAILGVKGFLDDFEGYNATRLAKEADNENKRFSAVQYYDEAIAFFDEKDIVPKKLYKDSAINVLSALPDNISSFMDTSDRLSKAFSETEANLPIYKGYKDLNDTALNMYNTFIAFRTIISNSEYSNVPVDDKEKINEIYNEIGALADKEYTIDSLNGEKVTVTYDETMVLFTQYIIAYNFENYDKAYECLETLWEISPEFVQLYGYDFAVTEIQYGNFKNATKIAKALEANNVEDSSVYVIYAFSERMQGNYEKALKYADKGLLLNSKDPDLYKQKAIALMLEGKTEEAVKEIETGLAYGEYNDMYFTYLVAVTEAGDEEKASSIKETLKQSAIQTPEKVQKYLDGKLTVKQLFTEGTGDVR